METVEKKIIRLVSYYTRICGTNDPRRIAEYLGIHIIIAPLGSASGYYKYMKRIRFIFINEDILENEAQFRVVMAHELGHALLHRNENCTFMARHTLLSTSRIEQEANKFAAQLLIPDDMLKDYAGYTQDQFCGATGYPKELIALKLS